MSILWSDDCLSCLLHLPHTMEHHLQQVTRAYEELVAQNEVSRHEHHCFDDRQEEDETPVTLPLRGPN